MTPAFRWISVLFLAALTVGLLGYTVVQSREKVEYLEGEISALWSENFRLRTEMQIQTSAFYDTVTSDDFVARIDNLAETAEAEQRVLQEGQIVESLSGLYVKFPEGGAVLEGINSIAVTENRIARQDLRDEFIVLTRRIAGLDDFTEPVIEPEPVVVEEAAAAISTLVTAAGGILSGIMTIVLFVTGGGRRQLEEEMLALQVEEKRLEVERLRRSIGDEHALS